MIRTVVSDMGRVVLWFDNNIFLGKLAQMMGLPFEAVHAAAHANLDLICRFDGGDIGPAEFRDRVFAAAGKSVDEAEFWRCYNDIFWPNTPVIELLRRLKDGGSSLVLLSNTDPERFGFVRKNFPEIFFFDAYVISYQVKLLKPDRAIYLEAARRAESAPDECVFIDDMEENVEGARAAGLAGIHYTPGTDLEAELRRLGVKL